MKVILGILLLVAGAVLGLYVGVWLMFVGGIVQIVDALQTDPVEGAEIAWGIVRIVFAGALGGLSFWVLALPGVGLIGAGMKDDW